MKSFATTLIALFSLFVAAQPITVNIKVTDATCNSNGEVLAETLGGSGSYSYSLRNACGTVIPVQTSAEFLALVPCNYTLIVSDRVENLRDTSSFVLRGNEVPLMTNAEFQECDAIIAAQGGAGPYRGTYTLSGVDPIQFSTEDTFLVGSIGDELMEGTITDDCGNSRTFRLDGRQTRARALRLNQTVTGVTATTGEGLGPFSYTLESSLGSFSNSSGEFPFDQIGCDATISSIGICDNVPISKEVELMSDLTLDCVNFSSGSVEVSVSPPNILPYTFEVTVNGTTISSSSSTITGIPTDANSLSLRARNGCGDYFGGEIVVSPYEVSAPDPVSDCAEEALTLSINRSCAGPANLPIAITCTSCPGSPVVIQNSVNEEVRFDSGTSLGNYELEIENSCGDLTSCRDTMMLDLQPACDSIIARYVQRIVCENGAATQRTVTDPSVRFNLYDATGIILLASNSTGTFGNLAEGDYQIEATGGCVTVRQPIALTGTQAFDPDISVEPSYALNASNACELTYRVSIDDSQGPYELVGITDPGFKLILERGSESICPQPIPPLILPVGEYRIASLSRCAERILVLPDVIEERIESIEVSNICPGGGTLELTGLLRSRNEWRTYYTDLGLSAIITGQRGDFHINRGNFSFDGAFTEVRSGPGSINTYLAFGSRDCPIDSIDFIIPEYEPLELGVQGNLVCNTNGTAPLELTPRKGNPPYLIKQVDCADKTNTTAEYIIAEGETLSVPDVTAGTYCYVVQDGCGITTDFQVSVRTLGDQVEIIYECTPAVRLRTDSLEGIYSWRDAEGSVLGTGAEIVIPPSIEDRLVTLNISTGFCELQAEVDLPGRLILPELALDPASLVAVQCDEDEVVITATTDAVSTIFFDGGIAGNEFRTDQPGIYQVAAVNDLGCRTEVEFTVVNEVGPNPGISPGTDFCPGEPATLGISSSPGAMVNWLPGGESTDTIITAVAGQFFVTVTSANGCVGSDSIDFTLPEFINYDVIAESVSCGGEEDGSILVFGDGGTGTLIFTANGQTSNFGEPLSNLQAGTYQVVVQDENFCVSDTTVVIGQPDSLTLDLGRDIDAVFGNTVSITANSNADTFARVDLFPATLEFRLQDQVLQFLPPGTTDLEVTITNSRGCRATDVVRVKIDRNLQLYAPTAFSPNGDGVNDNFTLQGLPNISSINQLRVFDRWGGLVFEASNLSPNDFDSGWDGNSQSGRPLNEGTFIWQAEILFFDGTVLPLSGAVNLLR